MFGGSDVIGVNPDTWEWDGTAWKNRHPATFPGYRTRSATAYDAAHGRVLMFGGAFSSTTYADT